MNRWQTWRKPPTIAGNDADSFAPVDTGTPPVTDTPMNVSPDNGPIDAPSIPPSQSSSNDPSIETNETSNVTSAIPNTDSEAISSETNLKAANTSESSSATEKEPATTNVETTTAITNKTTSTSTGGNSITSQSTNLEKEPRVSNDTTSSNSTNLDTEKETTPIAPTPAATRTTTTTPKNPTQKPLVGSRYSVCRKSKTPFKDRKPYKGWYAMLEEFKKYIQKYNTSNIDTSPEHAKLKGWVKNQRRDYRYMQEGKPSNMYPLKVQKLREVGFDFRTLPVSYCFMVCLDCSKT